MDVHTSYPVEVEYLVRCVERLTSINQHLREEIYAGSLNMIDIRFLHQQARIIDQLVSLLQRSLDLCGYDDVPDLVNEFLALLTEITGLPRPHYAQNWEQYIEKESHIG